MVTVFQHTHGMHDPMGSTVLGHEKGPLFTKHSGRVVQRWWGGKAPNSLGLAYRVNDQTVCFSAPKTLHSAC